ncbi:SHOCT domain-containing protein [Rhodococcus ruber]|uniref:Uncharacterized protein n=1 Tax=Rhodococcus ruber TaxID=1830 RepID=A0A098BN71_9NOCA|nr:MULTISPECIES: hypothetical protein [Rhodococcus]AUM19321.1 hypothetical protein CSW53_23985 [Rhodococcus ruber]AXY49796.1 hypothetical protein YT1_0339 [Rhodococcus ruber]MBD8054851.1 SHOCT domain-containing protein [Rhodococcus ruber]MBP2214315.1 putative membrane protein [Rhodococcus ruber]MCD2129810.1 SHOCT domain-containing protein [Rhodococcus ruber]
MMFWYDHNVSGWGYVLMIIGMVGFWALVIFAVVALVRSLGSNSGPIPPTAEPTAEQVLGLRLARGEIDADEYRQRLEALHRTLPPKP